MGRGLVGDTKHQAISAPRRRRDYLGGKRAGEIQGAGGTVGPSRLVLRPYAILMKIPVRPATEGPGSSRSILECCARPTGASLNFHASDRPAVAGHPRSR